MSDSFVQPRFDHIRIVKSCDSWGKRSSRGPFASSRDTTLLGTSSVKCDFLGCISIWDIIQGLMGTFEPLDLAECTLYEANLRGMRYMHKSISLDWIAKPLHQRIKVGASC